MQYRNLLFLSLLLLGLPLGLSAQILDDSTKQVYGPTTTSFIREGDIYYQSGREYHPDTLVNNFYRFLPVERSGYRLQNLGNIGTAQQSVFYDIPEQIGVRAGFDVFDSWFRDPSEILYFNTRSPYTRLFYSQGGNGRSWVDVTHSRNINPRWNAGIDFRRITADKQLLTPPSERNEKQTVSTAYDLFTRYQDKKDRYQLMANLSRLKHTVTESGGIAVTDEEGLPENISDIIGYSDSPIRLLDAESSVLRINYHLYHQYKLLNALQLYHILDRETRTDSYVDAAPTPAYYHVALPNDSLPAEDFKTRQFTNQAGVKGVYGAGQWNAYVKHRSVQLIPVAGQEYRENELAIGGYLALQPDTLRRLRIEAELRTEGQYYFEALAQNSWLNLRYQRIKYKPAFIYEYRNTLIDHWNYDFLDPVVDRLEGSLAIKLGPLRILPSLQLSLIQNPLYFGANVAGKSIADVHNVPALAPELTLTSRMLNIKPEQGTAVQLISPRLGYALALGKYFHWDGEVQYTQVTGKSAAAFQVPEWLFNTAIYLEGPMFGGNMIGQLGLDMHLKTAYYADAYDPALRQFVVQQSFLVPSYPLVNIFFGFKIKTTRVFARMSHVNEGVPEAGYFVTPYYSGLQRTFDIGIDWLFFD